MRGSSSRWLLSIASRRANIGPRSVHSAFRFRKTGLIPASSPCRRPFSVSLRRRDEADDAQELDAQEPDAQEPIRAAPELELDASGRPPLQPVTKSNLTKLRVVPRSASYFTARPQYTDDLLMLRAVLREYQTLPICKPGQAPRVAWRTLESYRSLIGNEPLRASRYTRMLELIRRINYIHPAVRPAPVLKAIERFARNLNPNSNKANPILIDEWGRARGLGRRKSSTAQVWLVEGDGEILINGKTLAEAFVRVHDRESVLWALKATDRLDKYNAWAIVKGGGSTGQAEALTLGLAKALLAHEPLLKPYLRKAGVVARDARRVERKKHGRVKARKKPTWVKR